MSANLPNPPSDTPPPPPGSDTGGTWPGQGYDRPFTAVLCAVLYIALVIACFGFIGLLAGTDVVADVSTGPLVGPAMIAGSAVVLILFMLAAVRSARRGRRWSTLTAIPVGLATGAGYLVVGAVAFLVLGSGATGGTLEFLVRQLIDLYAVAVVGAAAVVHLVLVLLARPSVQSKSVH
jgi:hypothetical protein